MRRLTGLLVAIGLGLVAQPDKARAACAPLQEADSLIASLNSADVFRLGALRDTALDQGCTPDERAQISRWLALAMSQKAVREAQSYEEALPLLREALDIAGIWQVQNVLGDAARDRRDFDEAALRYQLALQDAELLADPASTYLDLAPSREVFQAINAKVNDTRLLASGFVTLPGRPACQLQTSNAWIAEVVVPIQFVTDETVMTEKGSEAAEELFSCLSALTPSEIKSITVIGHTDERGEAAYNQDLSERRAQAVKAYLENRGLQLTLKVAGRGESELFQPDDAFNYSQEERWQMSRRVEVDVIKVEQ